MLKAIGFLLGSTASVALLLAIVDPPSWLTRAGYAEAPPEGRLELPEPRRPDSSAPLPPPTAAATSDGAAAGSPSEVGRGTGGADSGQALHPDDATLAAAETPPGEASAADTLAQRPPGHRPQDAGEDTEPPQGVVPAPLQPVLPAAEAPDAARRWQPVWQAFGSELSAQGFAQRLGLLTGLDYRVSRSDSRSYEVVVAYSGEADLAAKLALIEETTGLSLAGGTVP